MIDMALAAPKYGELFTLLMWIGVGCGLFFLALSPLLKRWMHGIR